MPTNPVPAPTAATRLRCAADIIGQSSGDAHRVALANDLVSIADGIDALENTSCATDESLAEAERVAKRVQLHQRYLATPTEVRMAGHILSLIDRLRTSLASAEPERGAMMRAIRDGTGIEPCDDDGIENRTWIVPAEPEPVVCATLTEALIKFGALSDTDAERETATLTERLARENESVTISESQAADVLDEINAAIAAGRSMGHGAWAILNRVNGLLRSHQAEVQA